MAISHAFSNTVADGTNTGIVRPIDWNSAHNQFLTVTGNTSGQSTFSGSNIVFGAGANITISGVNATRFDIVGGAGGAGNTGSISAGTTRGTLGEVVFSNSNGISFGINGQTLTAQHNALTTARASNDAIGLNTAQSNVTWTVNSAGLSLDARGYAGTATGATSASITVNSNGVSVSIGPYLTTAMQSNAATISNIRVSGGTTSNLLSAITFGDANGVSFGLNAGTMTASHNGLTSQSNQNVTAGNGGFAFQTLSFSNVNGISFGTSAGSAITASHNAITTARASNDGIGLNTAQTNVTWTVNSAGLSLNAAGYAGTATTFNGANISGSITLNSNGLNLSLSGAMAAPSPVNISAGTTSNNLATVVFSNSNGVSFGLDGSTITASVNAGGGGATLSGLDPYADRILLGIAGGQASLWINQLDLPAAVQFDRFGLRITHSNTSNSSGSATISVWVGVYTRNASSLSSIHSTSFTTAITQSGTAGSYSNYGGVKILPIPWTTTITAGNYWVGIVTRTTTGGANMTFGNVGLSMMNSTASGYFGSGSNATAHVKLGVGVYSATTAGIPSAISLTQINGNSSAFHRQPAYLFMSNIF